MGIALIVIVAAVVGFGAYFVTKTPDSSVEQVAESVIDYELDLPQGTVDLTPEKNK